MLENYISLLSKQSTKNIDLNIISQIYDLTNITYKAELLDKLYILKKEYELLKTDYNKLDYYNNTGDLILLYYDLRNNNTNYNKEKKFLKTLNNKNFLDLFLRKSKKFLLFSVFYKKLNNVYKGLNNKTCYIINRELLET
jgi:hypothetical protein